MLASSGDLLVHHAKRVTVWAAESVEKIELFHLPSYAPEFARH